MQLLAKQIGDKGEIAILSATPNATNQNTWIEFMKDELKKPEYKDIKLVKVAYGNDDDQKSFQETQGLLQAYPDLKGIISPDDGRHRRRRPLLSVLEVQGQGHADRPRHAEPDAQVRQGRHRRRPSSCGTRASSATSPATPRPRSPPARSPARRATRSTPGTLGEKTVGKDGEVILGPPTVFDKANIDQFDF